MDSSLTSLVALLVAIGGIITALSTRRKNAAEINELITGTVLQLLKPLKERVAELEKKVKEQKQEIEDVRDWAERLLGQLKIHAPNVTPEKFIKRLFVEDE